MNLAFWRKKTTKELGSSYVNKTLEKGSKSEDYLIKTTSETLTSVKTKIGKGFDFFRDNIISPVADKGAEYTISIVESAQKNVFIPLARQQSRHTNDQDFDDLHPTEQDCIKKGYFNQSECEKDRASGSGAFAKNAFNDSNNNQPEYEEDRSSNSSTFVRPSFNNSTENDDFNNCIDDYDE